MKIEKTFIDDLLIVHIDQFSDKRGFFQEQYSFRNYRDSVFKNKFVQDNLTFSKKNVLRGLHFQKKKQQSKLIIVIDGKLIDYCVDLRKKSKNYLKVYKYKLNKNSILFVPKGFAHGYFAVEKTKMIYLLSDYRSKKDECGIDFRDKKLRIKLNNKILLSKKDLSNMTISEFENKIKTL